MRRTSSSGLGDVYLGAPLATPIDPRHRLVTTKYNPARTWTADSSVGIGGAYLCIYGMESPGGYQLVGRTLQIWRTHQQRPPFEAGTPWLLRFFDRIHWYPVTAEELLDARADFAVGRYDVRVEPGASGCASTRRCWHREAASIDDFRQRQSAAFSAERAAWEAAGEFATRDEVDANPLAAEYTPPEGGVVIGAPMTSSVWKVNVEPGDEVEAGQAVVIIEAMKTETSVLSPCGGTVIDVVAVPGAHVATGAPPRRGAPEVSVAQNVSRSARAAAERSLAAIDDVRREEVWISRFPAEALMAEAERIDAAVDAGADLPLAGSTFAVKDNIDVAGLATTAGCPAFAYLPHTDAPAVRALRQAGAVCIGKTNLDQFATGLVGTRSPYGAVRNAIDPTRISGGSSSGSAVAVALGLVDLALGTDTAGSGRVPAALNGIVGYKATFGLVSTTGTVPACASFDCVTVLAPDVALAERAMAELTGNRGDDGSRRAYPSDVPLGASGHPVIARAGSGALESSGSCRARRSYEAALVHLEGLGCQVVDIDLEPFLEAGLLLYPGPSSPSATPRSVRGSPCIPATSILRSGPSFPQPPHWGRRSWRPTPNASPFFAAPPPGSGSASAPTRCSSPRWPSTPPCPRWRRIRSV